MIRKTLVMLMSASLTIQGCAIAPVGQTSGSGTAIQNDTNAEKACNEVAVSIAAAAICALIPSKNRAVAAVACGAAAAMSCYLVNSYQAKQLKSAQQAEAEYQERNRQQLPEKTTVVAYRTDVNPHGAFSRSGNQKAAITSYIEVVKGKNDGLSKIEEEVTVVDSGGQAWVKPTKKVASADGQSGAYTTTFTLPIHDGMSQGVYTVKKALYVNGRVAQTDQHTKLQVVSNSEGMLVVASAN